MAKCKECGGELFETSKFCPECGAPVTNEPAKNETPADVKNDTVADAAAQNILDDIPDIKKIDITSESTKSEKAKAEPAAEAAPQKSESAAEIHTEKKNEAETKQAEKPASKPEAKPAPTAEPEEKEKNVSTEPEKKKSKAGIVVIIVILIIAAICACAYFFTQNGGNNNAPAETVEAEPVLGYSVTENITEVITETAVSEESVTAVTAETTVVSEETETAVSAETTVVSEGSESDVSTETTVVSDESATAESTESSAEDIVLEPEHVSVMGPNISMEFLLSEQGVTADMFTETSMLIAEYTTTIPKIGGNPMSMVMRIADTEIIVNPSSTTDNSAVFEYAVMVSAAEAAGFTAADIDSIAFKGTGAPIDVVKVTIANA